MSLNDLEEQVERIYIDMENELLLNIAKKLSAGKPMEIDKWDEVNQQPLVGSGEVNEWQLQRLKELNGLNEENAKIIAKYSGKTVEEVNKVFDRAREIGVTRDETLIQEGIKLGILNAIDPDTEELLVRSILSNAVEEILTTFNKQNNSLLASAGDEYRDIVNKVSSQVLAGTKTTNKAMQEAVSQLAEKGLTGFTARNGARWNPEGYTKMVIRTNTQNTINRIQDERIQACGGDFIEISSHIGARPLCAQDQGQVFSLSGYSGYIEDLDGGKVKVRRWSSSTYGKPAGIFGINCRHSRYMFVPGLSKKREMDFTKKENDKIYAESQRQRQYERTIRNKKREIAMLKQTGAEPSYIKRKQNSLSNTRKEYLEFLDKTGRTRITANEWIGSTSLSPKNISKTRKKIKTNINYSKVKQTSTNLKPQEYNIDKYKDNIIKNYKYYSQDKVLKSMGRFSSDSNLFIEHQLNSKGFDKLPTKLSVIEFDKLPADNYIKVKRGLKNYNGISAEKLKDDFINGKLYVGRGNFGSGTYTAVDSAIAENYGNTIIDIAIPKNVNIINYKDLLKIKKENFTKLDSLLYSNDFKEKYGSTFKTVLEKSLEDYSTYAIYMNYDVIQVDVEDYKRLLNITDVDNLHPYYIILNRGKVIVKE